VFTLAGIWHFLKRQGVPLVYSWPAAATGINAYFADKESGEFTIFHLKETLRTLFKNPEIENIHIIAHSRGTDVVTTTLRELIIENRASGGNPRQDMRIENLILAAPDLVCGIIKQRLMAEQFGPAFGKITIYTSQDDSALGISQWLTNSLSFGRLNTKDININEENIFNSVGNVSLIKVPKSGSFIGHDYFHSNPAVSSDLINLILHKVAPGSDKRPLKNIENNFWQLDSDYLVDE
jgi:esterase/lipase superfamily enzyme